MTRVASPGAPDLWDRIDVEALLTPRPRSEHVFEAAYYEPNSSGFLFGGQLLGQSLMAAAATVEKREPNAMFLSFIRPASSEVALEFHVEATRDGRRVSSRSVFVRQAGRIVCQALVSFHVSADDHEHQDARAPDVPGPSRSPTLCEHVEAFGLEVDETRYERLLSDHPVEVRYPEADELLLRKASISAMRTWMRIRPGLAAVPGLHASALAYATDWVAPYTPALRHIRSILGEETFPSSSNHSLWFHRPIRFDDWLLLACDSPIAAGGRGLTRGQVFTRSGELVATMAQESLYQAHLPGARAEGEAAPRAPS